MPDALALYIVTARAADGRSCSFAALAEGDAEAKDLVRQEYELSARQGPWTLTSYRYQRRCVFLPAEPRPGEAPAPKG